MTSDSLSSGLSSSKSRKPPSIFDREKLPLSAEFREPEAAVPRPSGSETELTFPEGGARAWLTVLGGCCVLFCTFGVVQSFGVFQDYYTRFILNDRSASEISWIGSTQVFCLFAFGLPAGKLFDLGYFHHCLIAGSLVYLISTFLLSLAKPHHYYQFFLAQSLGIGIAMGFMFVPALSVVAHYFRRRRSLAMGMVITGASLGGVIYPLMLNNIFENPRLGFAWGVRALGFLDLGLLIIANSIMRTRLPPNKNKAKNTLILKEILTDVPYLLYLAGSFLVFWGAFVPFFYLQLWTSLHGISATFTKYSITIMNGSSIFGRIFPNLIADKYGPLNTIIVFSFVTGCLVFAMFGATTVGGVVAFGIVYGFFSGGTISLATPGISSYITHGDGSDLQLRIAFVSFALSLPLLTGNPLAGALLSPPRLLWFRPIVMAAVFLIAGAVCYIVSWRFLKSRKTSKFF